MIKLFNLSHLENATFLTRPNRFIAEIKYNGTISRTHIHDPGRLKELLVPQAQLLIRKNKGKLPWYVEAVYCDNEWVLIDSALQPKIAKAIFPLMDEFKNAREIKSEVSLGKSRIDFMMDGIPLECKGVSLVKDGIAQFPDAPTERGARHVEEIIKNQGILLFIIFKKARFFAPNTERDPYFSQNLINAVKNHIKIICVQIHFDGEEVFYDRKIPIQIMPKYQS